MSCIGKRQTITTALVEDDDFVKVGRALIHRESGRRPIWPCGKLSIDGDFLWLWVSWSIVSLLFTLTIHTPYYNYTELDCCCRLLRAHWVSTEGEKEGRPWGNRLKDTQRHTEYATRSNGSNGRFLSQPSVSCGRLAILLLQPESTSRYLDTFTVTHTHTKRTNSLTFHSRRNYKTTTTLNTKHSSRPSYSILVQFSMSSYFSPPYFVLFHQNPADMYTGRAMCVIPNFNGELERSRISRKTRERQRKKESQQMRYWIHSNEKIQ